MSEYLHRVSHVTWNKKLMLAENETGNTHFGLAPPALERYDIVCILLGCSVPVVLREHKKGTDHNFEFIAEAYVYGMMDGEALAQHAHLDQAGIEAAAEEFRLR